MPGRNIFICYRRDDAEGYAGRIFDRLNSRFPRRVFMDVMAIRPGADFTRVIQDTVGSCGVLVAIIGRHWLTITDESSRRRIDQPDDYVRHEIASALNRNVMVIPVLVRDAKMPKPELLPPDLTLLAKRNALEITDTDFDHDIQRLITAIEDQLGERRPVVPLPQKSNTARNTCLIVGILGAIAAVVVGFIVLLGLLSANQNGRTTSNYDYETPVPTVQPSSVPLVKEPSQQSNAADHEFLLGHWVITILRPDNVREQYALDIMGDFTYQTNTSGGRLRWEYFPDQNSLVLYGWGTINLKGTIENGYVGYGELNRIQCQVWITRN